MRVQVYPEHDYDKVAFAEVEGEGLDQLRHLQHIIGGYIEQLHTTRTDISKNAILVDEDARSKHRKINYRATSATGYPTILTGTVVIVGLEPNPSEPGTTRWVDIHD